MIRKLITVVTTAVAVVFVLSISVFAAEFEGTVSAVDDKGTATIKATDGKEYKVSLAEVKAGDTAFYVYTRLLRNVLTGARIHCAAEDAFPAL